MLRLLGAARAELRPMLMWTTFGSVPAGEAFSRRLGGTVARVNRNSELLFADLDWALVHSWITYTRRPAAGYRLDFLEGPIPSELIEDAARFHHIMQTAPRDDLEVGGVVLSARDVAEIDRHLAEAGRERWMIFVRVPAAAASGAPR